jgi:paraquat-inducible protein A
MEHGKNLIACRNCDTLFRKRILTGRGEFAYCPRCGSTLYDSASRRINIMSALTLAALITFLIAQACPILELVADGITSQTTLAGAIAVLWQENMQFVAVLVFGTTILFPLTELVALLYVLIPIRAGYIPPGFNMVLRTIQRVRPWEMIEVFMLAVLVAMVKMLSLARMIPETALFAFGALTIMLAVLVKFDLQALWDIADGLSAGEPAAEPPEAPQPVPAMAAATKSAPANPQPTPQYVTALQTGLVACDACGQVAPHKRSIKHQHCSRCDAVLHRRHPDSLRRTWALLIAAALLYIPANLLPVMHTASLMDTQDNTIMSGVIYFWTSGEWPLAVIVFVASIMVPMLKISVLVLLLITAQRRSSWRPHERTTLYRIIERIGRWSMLDVFVVTLTVALVRFQSFAEVTAGPGVIAFGSVVILTLLASMQFDPRLTWDGVENSPKLVHASNRDRPETPLAGVSAVKRERAGHDRFPIRHHRTRVLRPPPVPPDRV